MSVNLASHYIPAFTEQNGRLQRAACGRWVRAAEHASAPTCDDCQAYVESEAATAHLTHEDVFGASDPSTVVKHIPFNPTAGYTPRGARR